MNRTPTDPADTDNTLTKYIMLEIIFLVGCTLKDKIGTLLPGFVMHLFFCSCYRQNLNTSSWPHHKFFLHAFYRQNVAALSEMLLDFIFIYFLYRMVESNSSKDCPDVWWGGLERLSLHENEIHVSVCGKVLIGNRNSLSKWQWLSGKHIWTTREWS